MADFTKYFRAYMDMKELLKNDFTYNYIIENLKDADKGGDTLNGKTDEKVIDMDWVVAIEETLPYIQKAIDEQRRFIKQIENVVRIELAKKVGPDSVKHLSQHTNFIAKVENDMVTPNKILTTEREESFAIYENRVLMTLIRKALHFVDDKYSKMKDVPNDSYNKLNMTRRLELTDKHVDLSISYVNDSHEKLADDLDVLDVTELSDFDRIRRIRSTLNDFLNTQLMKEIAKEPEVRPPITQTNLLKKNPNFKKAMDLWNFLESYKRQGFEIVGEEYSGEVSQEIKDDVYFALGFEHFMMSIATNPGLRKILQQKYEEENKRLEEEANRPQRARELVIKAQLDAVRKEEMEIRLREIREREKKILELTNEIKSLKLTIEQKEQQILTLKGRVSMLEDEIEAVKEELKQTKLKLLEAENEIKALKEENALLKAKIEELNGVIDELNKKISSLEEQIRELNDRISVLMQENARQKTEIERQKAQIEEQAQKIEQLNAQVAEQLAKIAALTDSLEKATLTIRQNELEIKGLNEQNERLKTTLTNERAQAKQKQEEMTVEFNNKISAMQQEHTAEVKSLNDRAQQMKTMHADEIAALNKDFAERANKTEQQHLKELESRQNEFEQRLGDINKANEAANLAAEKKHLAQLRQTQRSVDRRVAEAQKAAEKQMKSRLAEEKRLMQAEIKKAEKKANAKVAAAKAEAKIIKSHSAAIESDFAFGCVTAVLSLAKRQQTGAAEKGITCFAVSRSKKGISLISGSLKGRSLVRQYRREDSMLLPIDELVKSIRSAGEKPVCITYAGVDRADVTSYAEKIKKEFNTEILTEQNKNLKTDGYIAVYCSKD